MYNWGIFAGFPGFLDRSKSKGIPLFQQYTNDEIQALDLIRDHLLRDTLPMEQPGRLKQDLNHTCVDGQLDHVNSGSSSVGQFENSIPFQAPQPFNVLQTDLKRKMPLLQESCSQDTKSPDLTPSIEPAELCDSIEVRNATREKTINLPGTSLKNAAKSSA
ncbi:hypothetical protein TIFTF001_055350, partial [Ficus carica]